MLKNLVQLEHKIGENVYHLFCDPNSPIPEIKEALFAFVKYVGQVEDQIKQQQAERQAEAPKEEEKEPPLEFAQPEQEPAQEVVDEIAS